MHRIGARPGSGREHRRHCQSGLAAQQGAANLRREGTQRLPCRLAPIAASGPVSAFPITPTLGHALLTAAALYALLTLLAWHRWRQRAASIPAPPPTAAVTVLKPLFGAEPRLYDNLRSFCRQDHPQFQLLFGLHAADDAALPVVERLQQEFPLLDIGVVIDERVHGINLKVGNLINLLPQARHDWLLLADSDIEAPPDLLRRVPRRPRPPHRRRVWRLRPSRRPSPARWPRPRRPLRPTHELCTDAQGRRVIRRIGFDFHHGRLDVSAHPFTGGTADDVRITTRYDEQDFARSLMGVLHETGHGLYEAGLPKAWRRQPVGNARGMTLHESQSLLMEMQACRSPEFITFAAPLMRAAFGGENFFDGFGVGRVGTKAVDGFGGEGDEAAGTQSRYRMRDVMRGH